MAKQNRSGVLTVVATTVAIIAKGIVLTVTAVAAEHRAMPIIAARLIAQTDIMRQTVPMWMAVVRLCRKKK